VTDSRPAAVTRASLALSQYESCPMGMTLTDVCQALVDRDREPDDFFRWMKSYGKTYTICNGENYSHTDRRYYPTACAAKPHGTIVFTGDVARWLNRRCRRD
jgi:hypothetical protein